MVHFSLPSAKTSLVPLVECVAVQSDWHGSLKESKLYKACIISLRHIARVGVIRPHFAEAVGAHPAVYGLPNEEVLLTLLNLSHVYLFVYSVYF